MSRLFTEPQWRAIAEVEALTLGRLEHDGFHYWCERKRILGGVFEQGEFYIGYRESFDEFRVLERASGLDFSCCEDKAQAIADARYRIVLADWYLPELIARWTEINGEQVAEWEQRRAEFAAEKAIRIARAEARAAKKLKVGRRRRQLFAASNGVCHYCRTTLELTGDWHVEHKMPKALGGSDADFNLVASCVKCNLQKKDKTDVEFFALLAARNQQAA